MGEESIGILRGLGMMEGGNMERHMDLECRSIEMGLVIRGNGQMGNGKEEEFSEALASLQLLEDSLMGYLLSNLQQSFRDGILELIR